MTKAELIRKLAKRSGIPDSEAKIFFEIFLRDASENLKLGEAIKLKNFGYFQFKRGMIKNIHSAHKTENNLAYADLMVFTPLKEDEESEDNLIFNIPSLRDEEFHYVDLFFSLSIGKPVIPLKGAASAEFFIPPTGIELKKLIHSRVEKLLLDVEIIDKHVKGSEFLLIDASKGELEQFEFNWESVYSENKEYPVLNKSIEKHGYPVDDSELEHVDWDFGENLSKEIEEEVLLDTNKDSDNLTSYESDSSTGIEWNFGIPVSRNTGIQGEEFEEVESLRSTLSRGFTNEFDNDKKINEDYLSTKEFEENVIKELDNFDRVKAVTSELKESPKSLGITQSELNLSWNFGEPNPEVNDENSKENDKDNLLSEVNELNSDKIRSYETPAVNNGSNSVKNDKILADSEVTIPIPGADISMKKEYPKGDKDAGPKIRKRTSIVFTIALSVIILMAFFLYAILNKYNIISIFSPNGRVSAVGRSYGKPIVIKRDYQVPVNYPYAKKDITADLANQGIDPSTIADNKPQTDSNAQPDKNNLSNLLNTPKQKANLSSGVIAPKKQNRLNDNIVLSAGYFSVQISSWKSKSSAVDEVEKFKEKGYQASYQKVEIPGKGIWYRVIVGGFKSAAAAKEFLVNNK